MPSQYEIDTKLVELMIGISFTMGIFSVGFVAALGSTGAQIEFVRSLEILFMMMFTIFLGTLFGLFIKWFKTYRTSLIRYLRK